MSFTLAQALRLEAFQDADARLLTGEAKLDHEVRWVHSSEIPDVSRFLSGGELLLTAGLGMGATAAQQRIYVREVHAAGAVALVIEESGRMFDRIPQAVVEEATVCGLPVIALGTEVPFAAVSAQVHEVLTGIRVRALTQERKIESTFNALLLAGGDYLSIMRELARLTSAAVILENVAHQVVASAGTVGDDLGEFARHADDPHESTDTCIRCPVLMRGQTWGWLHALSPRAVTLHSPTFAAERAATAVAISLLSDHTRDARDNQRSTALITRLVLGDLTGPEFVDRAAGLGCRLGREDLVVIVLNKEPGQDHRVVDTGRATRQAAIQADMGDYRMVITSSGAWKGGAAVDPEHTVRGGGISRSVEAAMLPTALTQARSAAAVARSLAVPRVVRFDDLGVERLLVALAQGPELASYVQDELGPILARDTQSATPLLPTLRAYLESDGNKSDAAAHLHIQRRTLYNRLDRISALLGRSLEDAATRQALFLATKSLDLLEGSPGPGLPRR
ncbi:PucR family transcriptional regulator [Streptomyces sp. NPDC056390]|uniref:PucR family transcriptional regulator n=1 Tax=Streptomyces sp. NPDC056390 TaxID=3345806 RepID=UPI0035DCD28A